MKKLFAMAALAAAAVSVNAEVTPRSPLVPWGAQAEIIITNDLTQKNSDGSWSLTADAQQWIEYSYDGTTENGTIQQTNRNNVWFDFYSETTTTYKAYGDVFENLTADIMFEWDGWDQNATKKSDTPYAGCAYVLNESTGQPYGDPSVNAFADLSGYERLEVTCTEGTPRMLFNRDVAEGQPSDNEAESHLIDNTNNGCMTWAAKYFSHEEGSTLWVVDLKKLVADKGYAHLHAIKGANWQPCTVTKMELVNTGIVDNEVSCDEMIIGSEASNWAGYLTVTSKTGSKDGLMIVGKNRYPAFYVTGTDKAKFYFSGSASTKGYPQIEVYEVGSETPVATYTGDFALTKSTWDHSTLLIADGLDKAKSYKIVARTMALDAESNTYTYEGGDIVLQVLKFYGDQAPMREDGLIISGSEIGSYINQHLTAYPEVTDFTLDGNGKYTIAEGIVAPGKFTLAGIASAPATIDASALTAPFVQFAEIAEDAEKDENGFVAATNVKFANIKVDALGQPLFSSNKQNYLIPELTIDNSVITLTGNPFVIDFRNGGVVANLAVSNSTVWAAEATGNSFYTGQSGKKATEAGLEEQIFSFTNTTLSNIAAGKNFFTHRQSGQTWLTCEVKNSIIANCGKDNFLASLNQGQNSANPKYVVEGNTFLKTVTTTNEDETTTTELANINDLQSTSDEAEEIVNPLDGVPFTLANALAGNFKVAASSQQAKYMTGDPRWKTPYATDAIKIEVDQAENTDFAAVLNEALKTSEQPSSITIQFFEAGEYPLTQEINTTAPITIQNGSDISAGEATILVNNGMTLGGAIKIDGVNLKAGDELNAPVITLQGNPYMLQESGFYNLGKIQLLNLTVSNLKSDLIYGNKVKNLVSEIETKNCQIFMAAEKKTVYNFNGGGVVTTLNFVNSTLDAAGSYFYSSQSGQKATEAGVTQQTFNISTSTIYRPAGKAFQHRQGGQTWLRYILKNSMIIIDGGKDNFVADMNAGQKSANPVWQVTGNAFQKISEDSTIDACDLQDNGDEEEPVANNIVGAMSFNDLTAPDFGGTIQLADGIEIPSSLGDPRWTIKFLETQLDPSGEVTYALTEGESFTSGQVVEVKVDEDVVATIQYGEAGEGYADFKAAKADTSVDGYTAFTEGNGVNGNKEGGTFYTITPLYTGVISAAVVLNADKKFHLAIDGEQNPVFDNNTVSEKYYGPIEFNVIGGKTYKLYCDGSKLGLFGFNYKYGPEVMPIAEKAVAEQAAIVTGIDTVQNTTVSNGAVYNMQGIRVAQPTKGLYIVNGKKVMK